MSSAKPTSFLSPRHLNVSTLFILVTLGFLAFITFDFYQQKNAFTALHSYGLNVEEALKDPELLTLYSARARSSGNVSDFRKLTHQWIVHTRDPQAFDSRTPDWAKEILKDESLVVRSELEKMNLDVKILQDLSDKLSEPLASLSDQDQATLQKLSSGSEGGLYLVFDRIWQTQKSLTRELSKQTGIDEYYFDEASRPFKRSKLAAQ